MITLKELNPKDYMTSIEVDEHLEKLLAAMNIVRKAYGKPMTVTSGLRSVEDQTRINPKAMKSKHLSGQACDIADPKGELQAWIRKNMKVLEEAGLYLEDFKSTPGWVHFQCAAPGSGLRIFKP